MPTVRYFVGDVERALAFYTTHLGFSVHQNFAPAVAILRRDDLELWLAGPSASAARAMPDGQRPQPGGWNRFVLPCGDLDAEVARLRAAGVVFRNQIISGPGGRQILAEDGEGNVIELFEAAGR